MAKQDVLDLIDDLTLEKADDDEISDMYDEILRELGFIELLTGIENILVADEIPAYKVALDTIRVLEVHSGNVGRLDRTDGQSLRAYFGSDWRHRRGTPIAHTATDQDSDVVRLVPIPDCGDLLTIIRTELVDCLPKWLELPVALLIISREFQRESGHQDVAFAQIAQELAALFFLMVGVDLSDILRSQDDEDR